MTMIRINLIAEKKAGAPKAAKKPSRQAGVVQEYLVGIVCVIIAFGVCYFMYSSVQRELNRELSKQRKLNAEYDKVKHWQDKKLEYEIQKELLNEKIQKITDLKDRREGPVKLMEDIANALPESVWLEYIQQGYSGKLTKPVAKNRKSATPSKNLGDPALVMVKGYAKTQDAITNFANKVINLDSRYYATDLNNLSQKTEEERKQYEFELYFKVKLGVDAAEPEKGG